MLPRLCPSLCPSLLLLCALVIKPTFSVATAIECRKSLTLPQILIPDERQDILYVFRNYSKNPEMRYRCYKELLASAYLYKPEVYETLKGPRSIDIKKISELVSHTTVNVLAMEAARNWSLDKISRSDFGCSLKTGRGSNYMSNVTFVCAF